MRFLVSLLAAAVLFFIPTPTFAADGQHAIGGTFSTGAQDIFDFYDSFADTSGVPIGLSYRFIFNLDSGLRVDVGLGPVVLVLGDFSYFDLPLSGTVGWNLNDSGNVNPYARGGFVAHVLDGDMTEDSSAFGALGAVGIEFSHQRRVSVFIEAGIDTSEVTFGSFRSAQDIELGGFMFTVGAVLGRSR